MKNNRLAYLNIAGLVAALGLSPASGAPTRAGQAAAAPAASVPAPRGGAPVDLHLQGTRLRAALEILFTGSGLQLAIEPGVPDEPITLSIRGVPFDTALRTLLRLVPGVTYRKEGEIYVVGLRQPAPQATVSVAELPAPVEPAAGSGGEEVVRIPLNYIHPAILAYVLGGRLVPTEDQFQPGLGGYGGYGNGFNGRSGIGAYGNVSGSGLGPGGVGNYGSVAPGSFPPGYGTPGSTSGVGPNTLVNPLGNSVVVAPQPRRY